MFTKIEKKIEKIGLKKHSSAEHPTLNSTVLLPLTYSGRRWRKKTMNPDLDPKFSFIFSGGASLLLYM